MQIYDFDMDDIKLFEKKRRKLNQKNNIYECKWAAGGKKCLDREWREKVTRGKQATVQNSNVHNKLVFA